jgi:hypothetical protein
VRVLDVIEMDLLEEVVTVIDRAIDRLEREIDASPDPDGFGLLDSADHFVGLGFAACQTLVTSIIGRGDTSAALAIGPEHPCGHTIVAIVWAAANSWKHRGDTQAPRPQTRRAMQDLGVESDDYPLINVLAKLLAPHPPRFRHLVPFLAQWAEAWHSKGSAGSKARE